MSIIDSKQNKRSLTALYLSHQKQTDPGLSSAEDAMVGLHYAVIGAVSELTTTLRNLRTASQYLSEFASKGHGKPRNTTNQDVILYHFSAALHEAGVYRYRLVKLFNQVEKHFLKEGDKHRAEALRGWKQDFESILKDITEMRRQHVHDSHFLPRAISQYATWAILNSSREKLLPTAYKRTARDYARMWRGIADLLDEVGAFYIDLIGLVLDPTATEEEFEEELNRVESRLRAIEADARRVEARREGRIVSRQT